jgi:hypothetical protein
MTLRGKSRLWRCPLVQCAHEVLGLCDPDTAHSKPGDIFFKLRDQIKRRGREDGPSKCRRMPAQFLAKMRQLP